MSIKIIISIILFLLFGGLGYFALVSFSEYREYKKSSIEYWILTPSEIANISGFCESESSFIYSAADGAKPLITHLKCKAAEIDVVNYLLQNGYAKKGEVTYQKDRNEIELTRNEKGALVMVSLLIFL